MILCLFLSHYFNFKINLNFKHFVLKYKYF
nr:MAG TPA: hypothetical protein [Bacteriophage sp.]